MEYTLQLIDEKVKRHQVTALHLTSALAFIGAGAIIYVYNFQIKPWGLGILLAGLLLLIATIVKNKWVTAPASNLAFRVGELVLSLGLCGYSVLQHWNLPIGIFGVLAAGVAFAIFWERSGDGKQYVYVSEEGIKLPVDSRKRFIEWVEVSSVIVKFGTLSIDCADNRLFQWNVHEPAFNQGDFDAFCVKQIEEGAAGKKTADW